MSGEPDIEPTFGGMLDTEPYHIGFSNHAKDQLRRRFGSIWDRADRPILEPIKLTDPEPHDLFKESIEVEHWSGTPAKYHPRHGIVFVYEVTGDRVGVVKTVLHRTHQADVDDFPACPVCGSPTDSRIHDPCPFCEEDYGDQ